MDKEKIRMEKAALRKEFLHLRKKMEPMEAKRASEVISRKILSHPLFGQAKNIMTYMPFQNEVDIYSVIEQAWDLDKQVFVPKTFPEIKQMEVYMIQSWDDLERGHYQINEPDISDKAPFPIDDIELILIPGVAFDLQGYRLGYGGGYYDRFFDRFNKLPPRLGIAFDFQIIDQLPIANHDYALNEIITDKRFISL